MRRLALWAGLTMLPACCVFARANYGDPASHLSLIERLEAETPAMVRWYDTQRTENGHPVHYDDPDKIPDKAKTNLSAYCSAVWVSPDTMLTAAHCVDDIGKPEEVADNEDPAAELRRILGALGRGEDPRTAPGPRWDPTGQAVYYSVRGDIDNKHMAYHSGKVSAFWWDRDMALVKADAPGQHPYAALRRDAIRDGEEVHVVGHPAGMWWTYVHGYVSAQRPQYHDDSQTPERIYPVIQVSAPIYFGNSGGPAFDAVGNLIGMADSVSRVPNTAYFIDYTVIRQFLEHERIVAPEPTKPQ